MSTIVDAAERIWLGGRAQDVPRLLHFYEGSYYLFCLGLSNHEVQAWEIDPASGPSYIGSGERSRTNVFRQPGGVQIDSDAHWDLASTPTARIVYFEDAFGGVAIAGWNFSKRIFEFGTLGPFVPFGEVAVSLYSFGELEDVQPLKVAMTTEDINVQTAHLIYGPNQETVNAQNYARARAVRFSDVFGFYSARDITGLSAYGQATHSRPRACARNARSVFFVDVFVTQQGAAGAALWRNRVTGGFVQGLASRVSQYFPFETSMEIGLPWHSIRTDTTALAFASAETDRLFVNYGPVSAIGDWSPATAVELPSPPNASAGGGSLHSLVGARKDGTDTVYAVGFDGQEARRRIFKTSDEGGGVFGPWEIVLDVPDTATGYIASMTATANSDGDEVCIVYEVIPEGSTESGRTVFYYLDSGAVAAGPISSPWNGVVVS